MQVVPQQLIDASRAPRRIVSPLLYMSFIKGYNANVNFFTIGVSKIGGPDIIKGNDSVLQEWDKYNYVDYTNRLISYEYNHEYSVDPNIPVIMGTADLILDNSDDFFTPSNTNSPIYGKVLPQRPLKLYTGFDGYYCQVFTGVTDGMPELDLKAKTAKFHCIDFLYSIINRPLDNDVIYTNKTTDYIIGQLLQASGLNSSQYLLDAGGQIIPFAYFKKGSKLKDALRDLVQAELGRLYMSETGMITFENRANWNLQHNDVKWYFTKGDLYDMNNPSSDDIINVVETFSNARSVAATQQLYKLSSPVEVPANSSIEAIVDFKDDDGALPVTSAVTPVYYTSGVSSFYTTNIKSDGTGSTNSSAITLSSSTLFSTAYKYVFTNSSATPTFITELEIWGTPAIVTKRIYSRKEDTTSTSVYDEKPVKIENDLIQDTTAANTIGSLIIADNGGLYDKREVKIPGIPQLQVGDLITYNDDITHQTYSIIKVNGIINENGFIQNLVWKKRNVQSYFAIGISAIGGNDAIAP